MTARAPRRPALVLTGSDGTVRVTAPTCRIGRAPDNDLVLDDAAVSRHHCKLAFEDGHWILRDLGSANGTWFEGRRVTARRLDGEGTLGVGRARLHLAPEDGGGSASRSRGRRRAHRPGLLAAVALVLLAWAAGRCDDPAGGSEIPGAASSGAPAPALRPPGPPSGGAPDPPTILARVPNRGTVGSSPAAAPGAGRPAAVRRWLRLAEDRWSRRAMAPANLWEACRAWARARALLAGRDGEADLRHTVEARLWTCEAALDGEVARLEFTAVRHRRFGREAEADAVWRRVLRVVPDRRDPRHLRARAQLSEED